MATAEVQHPVPTAVHDGSCFQEGESHKVPVQDDVPRATEVEEAPGEEQAHANGVSEEVTKGHEEDSKENYPKDNHEDEAAVAVDAGDHDNECLMQAVSQEVEAKLGIVQDDVVVDSAAAATNEVKPPKEEEAERRREVPRKAAAAKAVVVPVDDDDVLVDGEAAAPAEAASDKVPEKEEDEGADRKGEEDLKEEKAHDEE